MVVLQRCLPGAGCVSLVMASFFKRDEIFVKNWGCVGGKRARICNYCINENTYAITI